MRISGIQKLTLLDYPGIVACTVFIGGCNFRCPYCHNASLVTGECNESMDVYELTEFLDKRRHLLDGVVVTGGEPTVNPELPQLLEKIKEKDYLVKLDTNGSSPGMLSDLISAGLVDYIAMDIKSSPDGYAGATGLTHLDITAVDESRKLLLTDGVDYEFRTTLVRGIHRPADIPEMAEWIRGAKAYYLQQFKDSGDLVRPDGLGAYDREEMYMFADVIRPYVPAVEVRGV